MKRTKIEIYQSQFDGQWRWHMVGGNGEVMCQGEPHPTEALAKSALRRIKLAMPFAKVVVKPPVSLAEPFWPC